MEVAPGGSGDEPVTPARLADSPQHRPVRRRAAARVRRASSAACWSSSEHQRPRARGGEQERYGDVLAAARDEVEAFINIDYRDAQASIDAVAAGATGEFAKQYDTSSEGVVELLEQSKSVMDGEVLWAGVTDLDADSATVLVATNGTVQNTVDRQQAGRPLLPAQARPAARRRRVAHRQPGVRGLMAELPPATRLGSRNPTGRPRKIAGQQTHSVRDPDVEEPRRGPVVEPRAQRAPTSRATERSRPTAEARPTDAARRRMTIALVVGHRAAARHRHRRGRLPDPRRHADGLGRAPGRDRRAHPPRRGGDRGPLDRGDPVDVVRGLRRAGRAGRREDDRHASPRSTARPPTGIRDRFLDQQTKLQFEAVGQSVVQASPEQVQALLFLTSTSRRSRTASRGPTTRSTARW